MTTEINNYKEKFINHLKDNFGISHDLAESTCDVHLESGGIGDLSDLIGDAEECVGYWQE